MHHLAISVHRSALVVLTYPVGVVWLFQFLALGVDIPRRCDVDVRNFGMSDTIQGNVELSAPVNAARNQKLATEGGAASKDRAHGASRILMPRRVKLLQSETVSIFGRECSSFCWSNSCMRPNTLQSQRLQPGRVLMTDKSVLT